MGVVELVLVFGMVLGWAVWELVKLRREQRRADALAKAAAAAPASVGSSAVSSPGAVPPER
jgi:predicted negative regulator of RcsB-dependent stress response